MAVIKAFLGDEVTKENKLAEIDVMVRPNGSYTFEVPGFGIVDHFPNSGKLLIRRENQWVQNGDRWIKRNVLPF